MISFYIKINGREIRALNACRIKGNTNPDTINAYEMPGFDNIKHCYGDGAEVLAAKMLQAYVGGKA